MKSRKHEVTRQGCFHGNACRLAITSLTDKNDVGVLPEKRSQNTSKVQTDVLVNLDLVYTLQIVLNRIFRRGNIGAGGIDFT